MEHNEVGGAAPPVLRSRAIFTPGAVDPICGTKRGHCDNREAYDQPVPRYGSGRERYNLWTKLQDQHSQDQETNEAAKKKANKKGTKDIAKTEAERKKKKKG